MINVTKTYLPPIEEYISHIREIWARGWITNNGPLVLELEQKLKEYLGVKHLIFCSNGTIALQMAIKALGIKKEIITTPFSYVATINSILWESCTPVFVDVDSQTFCIDPKKIEAAISPNTEAILAVHVYGIPCSVEYIQQIASAHNLKVIYDGAHAFGVKLKGNSVFNYGDISTCSFHATKIFHTVEGGALITADDQLAEILFHLRQFGHQADNYLYAGINGKNSEIHAAMGLCNLSKVSELIEKRRSTHALYNNLLPSKNMKKPHIPRDIDYNFAYYPVVFNSEQEMQNVRSALESQNIFPRRYFYPPLNQLPYFKGNECPIAESISKRVLTLPLSHDITSEEVKKIALIVTENLG